MTLNPSPNDFECKSAMQDQWGQQENYKLVIQRAFLIICTKKLSSTACKALMDRQLTQNMVHNWSRVQIKHFSIPANQTSINFDNMFAGALPNLVVVCLVSDADLAGGFHMYPFNFRNFCVKRIEFKRNYTFRRARVILQISRPGSI